LNGGKARKYAEEEGTDQNTAVQSTSAVKESFWPKDPIKQNDVPYARGPTLDIFTFNYLL
jgi:hypothetical protein